MTHKSKPTTYVFIDATNIIYGATRAGWKVDFQKLFHYLKTRYEAKKIYYFAGVDNENPKQLKFYEKLREFGYFLKLVPVKKFSDGKKKADVDSRMTFEMMLLSEEYQKTLVFTGDGDYFWVLEYLKKQKQVKLFGCGRSIAHELKRLLGGNITDINLIKEIVSYKK